MGRDMKENMKTTVVTSSFIEIFRHLDLEYWLDLAHQSILHGRIRRVTVLRTSGKRSTQSSMKNWRNLRTTTR